MYVQSGIKVSPKCLSGSSMNKPSGYSYGYRMNIRS